MNKKLREVVWFLIVLSGCIFTMTILSTIQGAPRLGWMVIIFLCLLQIVGLIYYLHVQSNFKPPIVLKIVLILLHLSSFGVLASFGYSVFSLSNEYHNPVEVADGDHITIKETDDLYMMYPKYTSVELATGSQPDRSDQTINLSCAATFQKSYKLSYDPSQLAGVFVSDGIKHEGYQKEGLGVFAYYNGEYHFANETEGKKEIENAVKYKGMAFSQFMVIDDGKVVLTPSKEYRCFRVLAELNNQLCVIDSKIPVYYKDFVKELVAIGVTHAFYVDMGSGWNYSWYRDNSNKTNTLIGMYWPFSHNWIVFKNE